MSITAVLTGSSTEAHLACTDPRGKHSTASGVSNHNVQVGDRSHKHYSLLSMRLILRAAGRSPRWAALLSELCFPLSKQLPCTAIVPLKAPLLIKQPARQ